MSTDKRLSAVRELLFEYTRSPSLQHIRDPYSLDVLAQRIMRAVDGPNSMWRRWNGPREVLLKASATCWIPTDDLRDFLNEMDGPKLTTTDVAQRLRAYIEEDYSPYPKEELKAGYNQFLKETTQAHKATANSTPVSTTSEISAISAETLALAPPKGTRRRRTKQQASSLKQLQINTENFVEVAFN